MLHEPEFESPEGTPADEPATKSSPLSRVLRFGIYGSLIAVFGLAFGVQASPRFAAAVAESVPEPVAAAMASLSGNDEVVSCNKGECCSSMSRASMMAASTEESTGCCAHEAAMAASTESGSCCSSNSALASAGECSGACPLSAGTVADDVAVSLPAPEEGESEAAEATETAAAAVSDKSAETSTDDAI